MKVLFVDDEPAVLDQAKIFLERNMEDLALDTAPSAEKGLELFDNKNYDAIVSDYQMPEMNGLEFLETVREDRASDIPFIVFTGKGREEVAMEALNLGADRYLKNNPAHLWFLSLGYVNLFLTCFSSWRVFVVRVSPCISFLGY